jgi:RNA polymerase sigma-70 factor (ECF subfamily)
LDYLNATADELVLYCLGSEDQAAWKEFVRRFQPLIARVALRVSRQWGVESSQIVDDLVQDTFLKLCVDRLHLLRKFKPAREDAIFGYVKVFTANLVRDHFKAVHSQKRGGGAKLDPIESHDSSHSSPAAVSSAAKLERTILMQEIDAFLRVVCVGPHSARDIKIFWLYYRFGLPASAIAALPTIALTTKGVETAILRLTRLVRQKVCNPKAGTGPSKTEGIRPEESF